MLWILVRHTWVHTKLLNFKILSFWNYEIIILKMFTNMSKTIHLKPETSPLSDNVCMAHEWLTSKAVWRIHKLDQYIKWAILAYTSIPMLALIWSKCPFEPLLSLYADTVCFHNIIKYFWLNFDGKHYIV